MAFRRSTLIPSAAWCIICGGDGGVLNHRKDARGTRSTNNNKKEIPSPPRAHASITGQDGQICILYAVQLDVTAPGYNVCTRGSKSGTQSSAGPVGHCGAAIGGLEAPGHKEADGLNLRESRYLADKKSNKNNSAPGLPGFFSSVYFLLL